MACGTLLTRFWGADRDSDGWECRRCRERSSEAQYRFAVAHLHRESAEWLTDREMEVRTGIKAGTVRAWSRPNAERAAIVTKRRDMGRVVYNVAEVVQAGRDRGLIQEAS